MRTHHYPFSGMPVIQSLPNSVLLQFSNFQNFLTKKLNVCYSKVQAVRWYDLMLAKVGCRPSTNTTCDTLAIVVSLLFIYLSLKDSQSFPNSV